MDKKSFKPIVIASIFSVLFNVLFVNFMNFPNPADLFIVYIGLFVTGLIAGYLSSNNEWLHGLISGISIFVITPVVISIAFLVLFLLNAKWTGGTTSDIMNTIVIPLVQWVTAGAILGTLGGKTSQLLKSKNNIYAKNN